ncbi:MAG: hypothetical protein RIC30_09415 [Marinoscillum sp.]|uniref:hypothetical protein n=1 Tax=Marinoscillum sp. TaxID=2024838 RepID=UPI0032F85F85
MSKLTNDKKRFLAERYYINEGKSGKWIAEYLEVTEATVSRWKKGRPGEKEWDTRKAEHLSAPHKIKELVLKAMLEVAEGEKPSIDTNALSQMAASLQKIDKQIGVQIIISVIMELDKFVATEAPEYALLYAKIHQKFIHMKASQS